MQRHTVKVLYDSKMAKQKSSKFSKTIQTLRKMNTADRCKAIRFANDKFIRDMVTHVKKLRNKKVSPQTRKLLRKHRKRLRFIANPKVSMQRKRKALSQKGGFVGALLPLLAPLAVPLLSRIFGGRR